MKVAHKSKDTLMNISAPDLMDMAKTSEAAGDIAEAIRIYKTILEKNFDKERVYGRLLILYRKQKDYKKELAILNTAIKDLTERYSRRRENLGKKVATLSQQLMKMTGLADKKGKALYFPAPLDKWMTRKKLLLKKISSSNS